MSKLVFSPPSPETPGYLRRMRDALEIRERLSGAATPEVLDAVVEFLLPYVTEPADRGAARDALWDANEEQFRALLDAVTGRAENPTP